MLTLARQDPNIRPRPSLDYAAEIADRYSAPTPSWSSCALLPPTELLLYVAVGLSFKYNSFKYNITAP